MIQCTFVVMIIGSAIGYQPLFDIAHGQSSFFCTILSYLLTSLPEGVGSSSHRVCLSVCLSVTALTGAAGI